MMLDDADPGVVDDLRKIKKVKLDAAERELTREMSKLAKIENDISSCDAEMQALAERRLAVMAELERSDLTFHDLCTYHAGIMRSDEQRERQEVIRNQLKEQYDQQNTVVDGIRRTIIGLQYRLERWEELVPAAANDFETGEE